jgi:hypothetical protein
MSQSPVLETVHTFSDGEEPRGAEAQVEIVTRDPESPSATENHVFEYEELDPDLKQIRLLRLLPVSASSQAIECELFHVSLDDDPSYKALSYTWSIIREDLDTKHMISLQGCPYEVRYNLWKALSQLQSNNAELVIWIDAICINQSSDTERNHQVAMMKMIYEQAVEVIVWLGPEESTIAFPDNHQALNFAQEVYDHRDSKEWIIQRLSELDGAAVLVSLGGVFMREYWQRIWIVQELLVAKRLVFYCGHKSIEGTSLRAVQDIFSQDNALKEKVFENLQRNEIYHNPIFKGGMIAFDRMRQHLRSSNPSFYTCLLHNHGRLSSDPRDMIYGLAALMNEKSNNRIKVDYNLSTRELFTKFTKQEIETSRRLDVITRVFSGLSVHDLPSWVPDWTGIRHCDHVFQYDTSQEEFKRYSAGHSEAVVAFNEDSMTFRGVRIGNVELCAGENMVSLTFYESCIGVIRKFWIMVISMEEASSIEHEAFARTLVFDKISQLDLGSHTKSEFLRGILGWLGVLFAGSMFPRNDSILLEYWKVFLSLGTNNMSDKEKADMEALKKSIMLSWMRVIFHNIWDRQFFITTPNIMGLAAKDVTEGGIICIPLGCCHPVVLQKFEDHYINMGEAYIDGFMDGKAMDMLERGELKLEEFQIH